MPLATNAVLAEFSNRHEQGQQDEYMYNNLANPMNYLPRNDSNNEWINKGTLMAEEGLMVEGDDEEENEFSTLFPDDIEEEQIEQQDNSQYAAEEIANEETPQEVESQDIIEMYEPSSDETEVVSNEEIAPTAPPSVPPIENNVDASIVMNMRGADKRLAHNNPGNIHISKFAEKYGAKAGRDDVGGKVAIFPSMEVGMKAMEDLIFSDNYENLTVREARRRWVGRAGDSENPIVQAMGGNKKLSLLSDPERKKLISQFIKYEDGTVYKKLKDSGVIQ
jgi:hypothetical protein